MMEETKQKTRPTGRGTGKGINVKTPGKGQSGVGVTKQGEKPKNEIKQPPLEFKHAGKVNLDNVEKVQTNVVEDYDKQARAYGKPPTKKMEDATERTDKFGHKLDTPHELPRVRGGKKKYSYHLKTPAPASPSPVTPVTPASPSPVSVYNNKQRGKIAKDVYGHYDDVSKLKEMTDKDIDHLVKKYQVNLKTEKKTEKKSKKNNKKKGR
jgi:hypothetical protein